MAPTAARNLVPSLLGASALAVASLSGLMLVGMLWPSSPVGLLAGGLLPITEVHQALADQALNPPKGQSPKWGLAEQQSWAELRIAPTRTMPWLRLAYIDAGRHGGRLGEPGLAAIQHAYDDAPYDLQGGVWRLAFVYNHWDQLTPDIRKAALDETAVLWPHPSTQAQLKLFPRFISNPAGRLAAALAISNISAGAEP